MDYIKSLYAAYSGPDYCRCRTRFLAEIREGEPVLYCPSCGEEITDPSEVSYIIEWVKRDLIDQEKE